MDLGALIKEIRYKSDMSQVELATAIGVKQSTISRIKDNKQVPTLRTAQRLIEIARQYKIKVKLDDLPLV